MSSNELTSTQLRNWENFTKQSGIWDGLWVRYNCAQRAPFASFRGRRQLLMRSPEFMEHVNLYQSADGDWTKRAFRGYGKAENSLPDGMFHVDFADSRGLFAGHSTGTWTSTTGGWAEVYFVHGNVRFSVVFICAQDSTPGMLSFIREEKDEFKNAYWSDQTALPTDTTPEILLPKTTGRFERISYPALQLDHWEGELKIDASAQSCFVLPDHVLVCSSPVFSGQGSESITVVWRIRKDAVKAGTVNFHDGLLTGAEFYMSDSLC